MLLKFSFEWLQLFFVALVRHRDEFEIEAVAGVGVNLYGRHLVVLFDPDRGLDPVRVRFRKRAIVEAGHRRHVESQASRTTKRDPENLEDSDIRSSGVRRIFCDAGKVLPDRSVLADPGIRLQRVARAAAALQRRERGLQTLDRDGLELQAVTEPRRHRAVRQVSGQCCPTRVVEKIRLRLFRFESGRRQRDRRVGRRQRQRRFVDGKLQPTVAAFVRRRLHLRRRRRAAAAQELRGHLKDQHEQLEVKIGCIGEKRTRD